MFPIYSYKCQLALGNEQLKSRLFRGHIAAITNNLSTMHDQPCIRSTKYFVCDLNSQGRMYRVNESEMWQTVVWRLVHNNILCIIHCDTVNQSKSLNIGVIWHDFLNGVTILAAVLCSIFWVVPLNSHTAIWFGYVLLWQVGKSKLWDKKEFWKW